MKKTSNFLKATGLAALLTSAAIFSSPTNVNAASIVTTDSLGYAQLYTSTGQKITHRQLAPNTSWQVGKTIKINGKNFYQVSTNEYLSSVDTILNENLNPGMKKMIITKYSGTTKLYSDITGEVISHRTLGPATAWAAGKLYESSNYGLYVQVSTHEYAKLSDTHYSYLPDEPIRNTIFDKSDSTSYDQPDTPTPDTNTNTGTNTNTNQFTANEAFSQEMLKQVNALRAKNNASPLTLDADLQAKAQIRANELITKFSHDRPDNTSVVDMPGVNGENIFYFGPTSPSNPNYVTIAIDAYTDSPGHFENMIHNYSKVGFGFAYDPATGLVYNSQIFAY